MTNKLTFTQDDKDLISELPNGLKYCCMNYETENGSDYWEPYMITPFTIPVAFEGDDKTYQADHFALTPGTELSLEEAKTICQEHYEECSETDIEEFLRQATETTE